MDEVVDRIDSGEAYDAHLKTYEDLRDEVDSALARALDGKLKIHSRPVRVKTRSSYLEKIRRKKYSDPATQMVDIVGARVVCLFLEDIPKVESIIRQEFNVRHREDKSELSDPEIFRYRSVHFECTIRDDYSGPHYDHLKDLVFEVQVRTILQDAWAVVEHTLAYKGPASIPLELRRDFSALVGLFHIADKAFQQLQKDSLLSEQGAESAVQNREDPSVAEDIPIDRNTVKALLREIYPERQSSTDFDYAQIAEEISNVGVETVEEAVDIIVRHSHEVLKKEDEIRKSHSHLVDPNAKYIFADVGAVRTAMGFEFDDYEVSPPTEIEKEEIVGALIQEEERRRSSVRKPS
jgi:ppGpp synthetase/RelA/SpoT-type nucleotidyltranferase